MLQEQRFEQILQLSKRHKDEYCGAAPSRLWLASIMGISGPTVQEHVKSMDRRGLIKLINGKISLHGEIPLTRLQAMIIAAIEVARQKGKVTLRVIADMLGIEDSTVHVAIRPLKKKGLIKKDKQGLFATSPTLSETAALAD